MGKTHPTIDMIVKMAIKLRLPKFKSFPVMLMWSYYEDCKTSEQWEKKQLFPSCHTGSWIGTPIVDHNDHFKKA